MSVKVFVNGIEHRVSKKATIKEVVNAAGVDVPTLCYMKDYTEDGHCRLCVVEVENQKDLVTSCNTLVKNNMRITTDSKRVKDSRKETLHLLASKHVFSCWTCPREDDCHFLEELRRHHVTYDFEARDNQLLAERRINDQGAVIVQDSGKCILCKRCENVCKDLVGLKILRFREVETEDGFRFYVSPTPELTFEEGGCIGCGQCTLVCPTGALSYKSEINPVYDLLNDPDTKVYAQVSPAAITSFAEEFNLPVGTASKGKIFDALKRLGFDQVTTLHLAHDLSIIETAKEFIERREAGVTGPLFSSFNAGFVRYMENYQPQHLASLSKYKTPHLKQGNIIKNIIEKDNKNVKVVSILPSTSNKQEKDFSDVDQVLTVRELGRMIRKEYIDYAELNENAKADLFTNYSNDANLLETSGGEAYAVVKAIHKLLTKEDINPDLIKALLGADEIREISINIPTIEEKINVAVVNGTKAAELFFNEYLPKKEYHFVEFKESLGGDLNGGGQSIVEVDTLKDIDVTSLRTLLLEEIETINALDSKDIKKYGKDFDSDKYSRSYQQKSFRRE